MVPGELLSLSSILSFCFASAKVDVPRCLPMQVQPQPELEAQVDPTKETNSEPEPEQGKLRCITPLSLIFVLN
jgi:hypothetical protein